MTFEIETLSFSEVHNHSTTPTSWNYFQTSQKLITTHNNNKFKMYRSLCKMYFGQRFHTQIKLKKIALNS